MSARSRLAMLLCVLSALPALAAAPASGTASGTLTINGKTVKLTHAYAAHNKDPFEKTKLVTYVVLSDQEVPIAAVHDMGEMMSWNMKAQANVLTFTLNEEKQVISTSIDSQLLKKMSNISGVGKQQLDVAAHDARHIAGRFYLPAPEDFFDNKYSYDLRFDAPYSEAPKEPGVESLNGKQLPAGGGDPGKAYLAYTKVLAAGDLKALRKALVAERGKDLDDPDFAKMFPLIQAMQAKNIKVIGGAVDGDKATLMVTGKDEGAVSNGTVDMVRQGGAWKVAKEHWKTKSD